METLAMFLLSYKQVVELEKAGTATPFLQLAPFIFILPVCVHDILCFEGIFV